MKKSFSQDGDQLQIVGDYLAWNELNGLFGRVMTVLDAVVEYHSTDQQDGIKSLVSNAIFCHDYKDILLFDEEAFEQVKSLAFNGFE